MVLMIYGMDLIKEESVIFSCSERDTILSGRMIRAILNTFRTPKLILVTSWT